MSEDSRRPEAVSFSGEPQEHDREVRDVEQTVDGVRWARVEYAPGAGRAQWCETPHVGYVLSGRLVYEFADGSPQLSVTAGQGFQLPSAPGHRGCNHEREPAQLFLVDALPERG